MINNSFWLFLFCFRHDFTATNDSG